MYNIGQRTGFSVDVTDMRVRTDAGGRVIRRRLIVWLASAKYDVMFRLPQSHQWTLDVNFRNRVKLRFPVGTNDVC